MITAYRHPFPTIVNRILVDCTIGIPHVELPQKAMKALWDTGATCTCISCSVATEIGLVKVNERELIGADNQPFTSDVFCVRLQMGHFVIENIEVCGIPMDGKSENMIIGMDVITKGDLSITNYHGQTFLTFREPSLEKIDYVAEIDQYNSYLKRHNVNVLHRIPDKCPCGSGKNYKNCHGQTVYAQYEANQALQQANPKGHA